MGETNVGIGGEMLNIFEKEKFVYLKKCIIFAGVKNTEE